MRLARCGDTTGTRSGRPRFMATVVFAMIATFGLVSVVHATPKKKPPKQRGKSTVQQAKAAETKAADTKPSLAGKQLDPRVLRYLPDDAMVFGWLDLSKMLDSPFGKQCLDLDSDLLDGLATTSLPVKLEVEQIGRIVFAACSLEEADKSVMILFCNEPVEGPEKGAEYEYTDWTAEKIGEATLWFSSDEDSTALCALDKTTILAGKAESLRAVLKRNGPTKLALPLDRGRRLLDPSATIALTVLPTEGSELLDDLPQGLKKLVEDIEAVNMEFDLGSEVAVRMAAICKDEASAEQLDSVVSGLWTVVELMALEDQEPEVRELLGSLRFDTTGSVFNARFTVPASMIQWNEGRTEAEAAFVDEIMSGDLRSTQGTSAEYTYSPNSTSPYGASYATPSSYNQSPQAYSGYSSSASYAAPQPMAAQLPVLDMADVVRLAEAEVDEEVIVRHVRKHRLPTALTADDLIRLTQQGISVEIITTLQELPFRQAE